MTFIKISMESLKQLLAESYEKGWRGSLELKDDVVEDLLLDAGEVMPDETLRFDGTVDSITISAGSTIVNPTLAEMNPDQIIHDFGLQDRPDISVPDVRVNPADRSTWNFALDESPPRVSGR